eukprot:366247-Chlamydomonas_euryale.AAC.12
MCGLWQKTWGVQSQRGECLWCMLSVPNVGMRHAPLRAAQLGFAARCCVQLQAQPPHTMATAAPNPFQDCSGSPESCTDLGK